MKLFPRACRLGAFSVVCSVVFVIVVSLIMCRAVTDEVEDLIKLSLNSPVRLFVDKNKKVSSAGSLRSG